MQTIHGRADEVKISIWSCLKTHPADIKFRDHEYSMMIVARDLELMLAVEIDTGIWEPLFLNTDVGTSRACSQLIDIANPRHCSLVAAFYAASAIKTGWNMSPRDEGALVAAIREWMRRKVN